MEQLYFINSIYRATEGEGIFVGTPQVFVRFQGCGVGCVNCDSRNTWAFIKSMAIPFEDLLQKIESKRTLPLGKTINRVSITGGDPLDERNRVQCLELTRNLQQMGIFVNVEAAGTRIDKEIFDQIDFISFDIKTPSTKVSVSPNLILDFIRDYSHKGQIKAVIANEKDFYFYYDLFLMAEKEFPKMEIPWVITPCFEPGEAFPQKRFIEITRLNESLGGPFRVIGQQHKWFFGPDKENV